MDTSDSTVATAVLCLLLSLLILRNRLPGWFSLNRRGLPLPPGTMGWPYFGETFQLYSKNPHNFFAQKLKKYGPVFKTYILGCPCVMVSTPEAARMVLATHAHLFKPSFPVSKERMLGRQAIFFQQGDYHTRLRRLVIRAFSPDFIRSKVAGIEEAAFVALRSWEGRGINTYTEMKTYAFSVAIVCILSKEELCYAEELKQCYYTLEKGYNSMPINLPGTLFRRAMDARRRLGEILADIMSARRNAAADPAGYNDLLGSFMEDGTLSDSQVADNVIGAIFAARDTTASVLTWVLKYLGENPNILAAVTEEQDAVVRGKPDGSPLTWADTKAMPFTVRVIQETMRVASVLSFTFREAMEDVEYNGYLIPKGWKVMPLFRTIHHDPESFPEPEKFDPTRFETATRPNTFLPFGNGGHCCPGNELAKLEMLVMLHHLTTKYRWSLPETGQDGIQFGPFALPMNGLPINIFPITHQSP